MQHKILKHERLKINTKRNKGDKDYYDVIIELAVVQNFFPQKYDKLYIIR